MSTPPLDLRSLVERAARLHSDAMEAACEAALVTGRGVVVIRDPADPGTVTVGTSPRVPYAEIHEFPSRAAYDAWLSAR